MHRLCNLDVVQPLLEKIALLIFMDFFFFIILVSVVFILSHLKSRLRLHLFTDIGKHSFLYCFGGYLSGRC